MAANPSISTFTAGGQTVALQWTTASNAAVAQSVLNALEASVTGGAETVVSYTGGSTLPSLPNSTITGIVVALGAGSAAHGPVQLSGNYDVGMSNDTSAAPAPQSWVVGSSNDTVMVGDGGGQVANFGANTQVFMTGQNSGPFQIGSSTVPPPQFLQEISLLGAPAPSAQAWIDGSATVDGSVGSTTVHLDTVTAAVTVAAAGPPLAPYTAVLRVMNNASGQNVVNIATSTIPGPASLPATDATLIGAGNDVVVVSGSGTVPATINGAGATGSVPANTFQPTLYVVADSATAVVNGGAGAVVTFSRGTGTVSVDGGTGARDVNQGAAGYFKSGSGGNAIMSGNATLATTLVGGGNNDIMYAQGQRTTMIGGAGNQTEVSAATVGGVTFEGNLGAGASTTTMEDQAQFVRPGTGGHATFITGNGVTSIVAAPFGHNTYQEGVQNTVGNAATILGFNTSPDSRDIVSLANPVGGFYTTVPGTVATPEQIAVNVSGGSTTLNFGDGTKWTIVGAVLTGNNFH
jgi:hypothetical protein